MKQLGAVLKAYGYDFGAVWNDLPEKIKDLLWYAVKKNFLLSMKICREK